MNRSQFSTFALALSATLLLAACATTPGASSSEKKAVKRAEARWEAVLAKDYASAYAFYSPGYRSAVSPVDFEIAMRLRRVKYLTSEYSGHECDESACTVKFRVGYQVIDAVPGVRAFKGWDTIEERWVKTSGEWWFLPED